MSLALTAQDKLDQPFTPGYVFTMEMLLRYGVANHAEFISEVSSTASGEFGLEQLLEKIRKSWAEIAFATLNHRDQSDIFILGGLDEVTLQLEDSQVALQTILASRFVGGIRTEVEEWEKKLSLLSEMLDEWLACQRAWMYLENIFGAEDIQKQLPAESSKFMSEKLVLDPSTAGLWLLLLLLLLPLTVCWLLASLPRSPPSRPPPSCPPPSRPPRITPTTLQAHHHAHHHRHAHHHQPHHHCNHHHQPHHHHGHFHQPHHHHGHFTQLVVHAHHHHAHHHIAPTTTTIRPTTIRPTTIRPTTIRPTTISPTTTMATSISPRHHHTHHHHGSSTNMWSTLGSLAAQKSTSFLRQSRPHLIFFPFPCAPMHTHTPSRPPVLPRTPAPASSLTTRPWFVSPVGSVVACGSQQDRMRKCQENPNVIAQIMTPNLLEQFVDYNKSLEEIQKSLEDYLETKRAAFARFYFLSNDELLEILSQTRDPHAVQPHLIKCFDAVKRLQFGEGDESKKMCALISGEGEKVPFSKPPYAEGTVEAWLLGMQNCMCETLYDNCKSCLLELNEAAPTLDWAGRSREDEKPIANLDTWYFGYPAQCIIMIGQIEWTLLVTEALLKVAGDENTPPDEGAMELMQKKWITMIGYMVSIVRRQLKPLERCVLGAKLTLDVHARDTNFELIHKKIAGVNEFDWQKQLRYYWEEDVDDCAIRQTNTYFRYGYEYLGNSMRLVVTPLTDKCYMTLTGGLNLGMGGAPAGPAGTGKTETTKDLAKALARQCVVMNCGPDLTAKTMSQVRPPTEVGTFASAAFLMVPGSMRACPVLLWYRSIRCVGMLRRVQPHRHRGALRDRAADPHHPGGAEVQARALHVRGERYRPQSRLRRLHHHESGLRRPRRAARQPQGTLPSGGDDGAGLSAHCRDHALLRGLRRGSPFPHAPTHPRTCTHPRTHALALTHRTHAPTHLHLCTHARMRPTPLGLARHRWLETIEVRLALPRHVAGFQRRPADAHLAPKIRLMPHVLWPLTV
jgi:hypothetical protein